MAITEITILVAWFVLYIVLRSISAYFGSALVFLTFIFAFIVSSQTFSSFYLLVYLIAIVLDIALNQINPTAQVADKFKAGTFTSKGFALVFVQLMVGLVVYIGINMLSRQVGGNIVGVPNLALTTPSELALKFKPVFESSLGIIENSIAIVIFSILMAMGILIPLVGILIRASGVLLPIALSALIMSIYHIVAYSVAVSLLLYAGFAFAMFIGVYLLFKDSLSADFAHYLNNAVVSLSRSLAIVT